MEKNIPNNWRIVTVEDLGEQKYYAVGDGDHGKIKPSDYQTDGVPYIRVGDMGWGEFKEEKLVYISEEVHNDNLKSELLPGDVLIAKTGATIGKCCIVPKHITKANTTSSVGKVSLNISLTSSKWLLYYFLSPSFFKLMWSHSHRTAQPGFNNIDLKRFPVPLPPLPEQKRIVSKLDGLFAHLEEVKKRLDNVPQLLKDFRQAVLTQAVTGKLTESKSDWIISKLEDITIKVGSGSTPKGGSENYKNEGIPLVRSMNIHFNGIKLKGLAFIDELQAESLKNVIIEKNDVLLNITGASIGRVCLADDSVVGGRVNQHVCIIRPKSNLNPSFLNIYLGSNIIQDLIMSENYGVTRQALTKTQILNFEIPVPTIEEQTEIVSRVDALFSKADKIEENYNKLKQQIEKLPQTFLAKAFKGELVAQIPNDGDATELLEKIKRLKEKTKKKK